MYYPANAMCQYFNFVTFPAFVLKLCDICMLFCNVYREFATVNFYVFMLTSTIHYAAHLNVSHLGVKRS